MIVSMIVSMIGSMIIVLLLVVLRIVLIIVFVDATGSGTDVAGVANAGLFAISLIKFVESHPAFLSKYKRSAYFCRCSVFMEPNMKAHAHFATKLRFS